MSAVRAPRSLRLAGLSAATAVAAATVGTSLNVLVPGESAALILGALVTIAAATVAAGAAARKQPVGAPDDPVEPAQ